MEQSDSETVGFIDVGTNSIHLLVVRFFKDSTGTPVFQDKEGIRLGQSLYRTGRIDDDAIAKGAIVVSRFARISRDLGADRVVAYATCAAREASNRKALMDALCADTEVEVIPGTEEARLIALGVFGADGPPQRSIEIDIGGGSTEIIIAERGRNLFLDSLSMGAVRYAYGLGIDSSLPISDAEYTMMRRSVDISSYHAVNRVSSIGFEKAYGSSGTMMALAEICAARRNDDDSSYLRLDELEAALDHIRSLDLAGRYSVPGLGKGRADIIVAGGAIAAELMSLFGIQVLEVSPRGLKQGMQIDFMMSRGYTNFGAREASVMALASRCHYDRKHAEAVCRNAQSIFDQSKGLCIHSIGDQRRNLMACACILHDIGEMVNYTNHHVLSQIIIENSDMSGFSCNELREMGLMVRFHHKKFPGPKDPTLSQFTREEAQEIRMCAMFLKIADVLDRHRNSAVRDIRLRLGDGCLCLGMIADEDASMELWRLDKIRSDFRKLFGMELVGEVIHTDGVQLTGP